MESPDHPLGTHEIIEYYQCSSGKLKDKGYIGRKLQRIASDCGATVLGGDFHKFDGGEGVTGVLMLAESHISIHTWPEHRYAAVDVFMCGDADPGKAVIPIKEAFESDKMETESLERGLPLNELVSVSC